MSFEGRLPKIITLTQPLLDVLHVDSKTAYALQPCFATRVQVYSPSRASNTRGAWMPHSLLIGQRGQLYLVDLDPASRGCVVNAALLRCDAVSRDTNTPADVEVVVEDPPNMATGTQSVYIRCSQQLSLAHICEWMGRKDKKATPLQRSNGAQVQATGGPVSAGMETGNEATSQMFPPFSYLLRFHCKNMPMGLHFVHMLSHFADPSRGELSLRRADGSPLAYLDSIAIVDPAINSYNGQSNTENSTRRKTSFSSRMNPFKQMLSGANANNSASLGQTPILYMRDVAKYEKKRFSALGKDITIPPPLDLRNRLRPTAVPMLEYENDENFGHAGLPQSSNGAMHVNADMPYTAEALRRLDVRLLEAQSRRFTFPATEDVLAAYGLPGFDSQFAIFLLENDIRQAVAQAVDRLIAFYPHGVSDAQDRLLAREVAREELLTHFGTVYSDLCEATRHRIADTSLDDLSDAEREAMAQAHTLALQTLREEMSSQEALQARDEADVFFSADNALTSKATGMPLERLGEEETAWQAEVAEAAAALEAVEFSILRIDERTAGADDCRTRTHTENSSERHDPISKRFGSVAEEAEELLRQIHEEKQRLQVITQNQAHAERKRAEGQSQSPGEYPQRPNGVSELSEETAEEVKRVRDEYSTWVLRQQEEIDQLRAELQRSAARFGVDAQWLALLNSRTTIVDEVLGRGK